jgi:hypothetical protein
VATAPPRLLVLGLGLCLGGCFMTADSSLWQRPRDGQREQAHDAAVDRPRDQAADRPRDRQRERSIDVGPDLVNPSLIREWVQRTTAGPPDCNGPQLAYHAAQKLVYMYGGYAGGVSACTQQTWTYDVATTTWTKLCDPCPPGPRYYHGMVYDSARQVLVLFGGFDGTAQHSDLWELGASGQWQLKPLITTPPPRARFGSAFDEKRSRLVIFGGQDSTDALLDDVWEYDGQKWSGPFAPTVRPLPRRESFATFASGTAQAAALRDKVVVLGGAMSSSGDVVADDMWTWDGSTWQQLCTTCTGTARCVAPIGFDRHSGRLILVGGWRGDDEIAGTMEYAGAWAHMSALPTARDSAGLTYDLHRDVFVLFGGNGHGCGSDCDETWEYVVKP